MNPYNRALARIEELETKLALSESKTRLAHAQNNDLGRQLRETFAILERVRKDASDEQKAKIDKYYPRRELR